MTTFNICKNDGSSLRNLLLLLRCFDLAAGLRENLNKSSIMCLRSDPTMTSRIASEIGCKVASFSLRYLGLPLRAGQVCKVDWLNLIATLDTRLSSWHGRLLSRAGRLTLINCVITASTGYLLSLFRATKWVIKQIDNRRRKFFWVGLDNISLRGKCLIRWNSLTCSKADGVLGILDVGAHNIARLRSWIWKLIMGEGFLWIGILESLYGDVRSWIMRRSFIRRASPI
ncbi:LINE-1 reverse transcriptase [Canna indica]|uniref:LINE-1 reverse transcriptase n=1 Tax=Canna indica TaxID=4628 RepID=A0AAQ3PWM3_9LILI|nr:LINE-1 reverse transcriptase [Canna indica]